MYIYIRNIYIYIYLFIYIIQLLKALFAHICRQGVHSRERSRHIPQMAQHKRGETKQLQFSIIDPPKGQHFNPYAHYIIYRCYFYNNLLYITYYIIIYLIYSNLIYLTI